MNTSSNTSSVKVMTQGDAVVQAVREVLKQEFKEGSKVTLSDDQRKKITEILINGFSERRIPLKASPSNEAKLSDPKQLQAYVKGLINNWLNKSPILSGKPAKVKSPLAEMIKKEPLPSDLVKQTAPKASERAETKKPDTVPPKK